MNKIFPVSIGYWTHQVNLAFRAQVGKRLAPLGLSASQAFTLNRLGLRDGLSLVEIANQIKYSHPAVVRQVNDLEAMELVSRERDENDLRRQKLFLTEKGRELAQEVHSILLDVNQHALGEFDEEEGLKLLVHLRSISERLRLNLDESDMIEIGEK